MNADALSHEDYLNAPGEEYTAKFDTPGEYGYYCEPHQGAGMAGKVVVNRITAEDRACLLYHFDDSDE